jgi:hypothetical protein
MVPATQMYRHYPKRVQFPTKNKCQSKYASNPHTEPCLQRHQEALAFHIGKTEIDATRIAIDISISYDIGYL